MSEESPSPAPENRHVKPRRGIYLLPNFLTSTALFAGFYAIVAANNAQFEKAAIAIFIAMIFDMLDGRVARLTNTQSAFGAEYDSLADLVSFGVAPAMVMYEWALSDLGRVGWLVAFLYTAATALRLARFNTQANKVDKRYFQGLASPAAAAVVAGFVWVFTDNAVSGKMIDWLALIITFLMAALMVSNIRYHSFKEFDIHNKVPFVAVLVIVLLFALISLDPPQVLFYVFLAYAISGPLLTAIHLRKKRLERQQAHH